MKRNNSLLIIHIIFFTLIIFYACRKDSYTTKDDTHNYELSNIGQKHNVALIRVYNNIKQLQQQSKLTHINMDSCVLTITKQTIDSYLQEEFCNELEKLRISLTCSETEMKAVIEKYNETNLQSNVWFTKDASKLTNK